jgi:hypothetical protein
MNKTLVSCNFYTLICKIFAKENSTGSRLQVPALVPMKPGLNGLRSRHVGSRLQEVLFYPVTGNRFQATSPNTLKFHSFHPPLQSQYWHCIPTGWHPPLYTAPPAHRCECPRKLLFLKKTAGGHASVALLQ